jgi:hypothetical protein
MDLFQRANAFFLRRPTLADDIKVMAEAGIIQVRLVHAS